MTSKEKMSEYLLRLQQWQRMSLGIIEFFIYSFIADENVGFIVSIGEGDTEEFFEIREERDQKTNTQEMNDISDYLHKLKII